MDIYINGKKVRADPRKAIGKGGEADVFQLDTTTALKLFKSPTHPDYQGLPQEQQAARDRLQQHQQKLPNFPHSLPPRVIGPIALATDRPGTTILGYTMPLLQGTDALLRYSERSFRQAGIAVQTVVRIFQDLYDTVSKLHFQQVVIGDFNDLNVLVRGTEVYLIDADSFQFAGFPCTVFTARFADPILCDPTALQPMLQRPPSPDSDWYAFTVMLMQCLLFVDPYGGVYKPKDLTKKVPQAARSLHRITVFHPEVVYPKPALPYKVLSDDVLHYFHQVFEQDQRGIFPRSLLDQMQWTHCPTCGTDHARSVCPICAPLGATVVKSVTTVRGSVIATRLFQTEGLIVQATVQRGQLRWLYHNRREFRRESGACVLQGDRHPQLQWFIQDNTTFLGYQGQLILFHPTQPMQRIAVDSRGNSVLCAVNEVAEYWVHQGQLQRHTIAKNSDLYPVYLGDVLSGQTYMWVGETFGLGFYQAGTLNVAFVFDAHKPGLNDRVRLPSLQGQLIHATCTFSQDYGWLFLTTQSQGQIYYQCLVIQPDGTIAAMTETTSGTDHWLATIGGKRAIASAPDCAIANFLLAATDDGIVRIDIHQGQLLQTKTFPDTEPFVDSSCQLLPAPKGLYVIRPHEIYQLAIA